MSQTRVRIVACVTTAIALTHIFDYYSDMYTIQCEVTASIMNRPPNDEDEKLGIIDCNPKVTVGANFPEVTKEILLCFRPHRLSRYYIEEDSEEISSSSALANTTSTSKSNKLLPRKTSGESSCHQ